MSVLVTGATGFIGREVVRQLLRTGRRVVALARKRDGAAARERVAAALGPQPDDELDVVEGDLTAPACGLAPADRRRLRATIATVIHCAGDTSFAPEALIPYRAGHIEGPRGLLETLAGGRLSRWAHLSTAFVCGRRAGTILESEGDLGQAFNNVYEGVKLESETVMRAAGRRVGVDVRVVRPSIVVGPAPATSGGNPSNLFFGFIRLAAALAQMAASAPVLLRIEGAPQVAFNIVPVGYVAAGLLALAEHPGGTGGTFHLVVRDAPTQAQMLAMITERLGVRGLSLIDAGRETFDGPSPLERRVSRMLEGYRAYLTQDLRFDDANARRLLDPFVVPAATLSRDAVHQLIDLALIADEIPAPAAQPGVR